MRYIFKSVVSAALMVAIVLSVGACGEVASNDDYDVNMSALTKGQPGAMVGDPRYCYDPANLCDVGEGACGTHNHCMAGLKCALRGELYGLPGTRVCHPAHCVNQRVDASDGEIGVDCGGECGPCAFPNACYNGVQDGTEVAIDCGGGCEACVTVGLTVATPLPGEVFTTNRPRFTGTVTSTSLDQRANRLVEFLVNGELIASTSSVNQGAWTISLPAHQEGTYTLTVRVNNGGDVTTLNRNYAVIFSTGAHEWSGSESSSAGQSVAARSVTTDHNRNVISAGVFSKEVDFGAGLLTSASLANGSSGFVVKYDPAGEVLWSYSLSAAEGSVEINDVKTNDAGEILILGDFFGAINLGQGPISATGGTRDGFIAKLSADGQLVWGKVLPSTGTTTPQKLAVNASNGRIGVIANFAGTASLGGAPLTSNTGADADFYIAQFSTAGAHIWSKSFGSDVNDVGEDIAFDASGNCFITGLFQTDVNFGTGSLGSEGRDNAFLTKFAPNGDVLWARDIGGTQFDAGVRLGVDPQGNVVVAGYFYYDVNFGGGDFITSNSDYYDLFLAKYDTTGAHLWSRQINAERNSRIFGLDIGPTGNIAITGRHYGTINLGLGARAAAGAPGDAFLALYGGSGAPIRQRFTSTVERTVTPRAVAIDSLNKVIFVGDFLGPTIDLGGGALSNEGSRAMFIGAYQ